jgi:hypothetical protein
LSVFHCNEQVFQESHFNSIFITKISLSLSLFTWMIYPTFDYGVTLKFLIQDVNIELKSPFMGCKLIWPFQLEI